MPISPSLPGTMTSSTSPSKASRSGVTISRCRGIAIPYSCGLRRLVAVRRQLCARSWRSGCRELPPLAEHSATASVQSDGGQRRGARRKVSLRQLRRVGTHVVQGTRQEEGLLRQVVHLALQDLFERGDRVSDRHVDPGPTGEDLGHVERLAAEDLQAPGPRNRGLVLLGEFVDPQAVSYTHLRA